MINSILATKIIYCICLWECL